MPVSGLSSYLLPTIVLYADDSDDDHHVPLSRVAVIMQSDMESLWSALDIDTTDWLPTDPYGAGKKNASDFPMLYAAQGFIAFERIYSFEQLDRLIAECQRAREQLHDKALGRTIDTIYEAAVLQKSHHGKLSFRAGICDPSDARAADRCPK